MRMLLKSWLLALLLAASAAAADDPRSRAKQSEAKTRNVEVTAEEEKVRDARGFEAIRELHKEMDDDHSGSIDRKETSGFMAEDMNMRSTERARREKTFHGEDEAITVDDMWEAWFESPERAWTTQELVHWISNVVNLPQYAPTFEALKLDGRVLPRLATQNPAFLTERLNIKFSVHRQKLRLSALDVVLFGHRENNNRLKDGALALLVLLLSVVLGLLVKQRRRAKKELHSLAHQLEELNSMKNNLEEASEKMKEERKHSRGADGSVVEQLRNQLDEANKKLEQNYTGGAAPLILQPLLRKTCEVELNYLNKQRAECVVEMKVAIEEVDKLRRKQTTLVASLKLATGGSSGSDQIDNKIYNLKSRMEAIQASTREAQERWLEIEALCGFPILYVNETSSASSIARSKVSVITAPVVAPAPPAPVSFYRGPESGSSSSISSLDRNGLHHHAASLPPSSLASPTGSLPAGTTAASLPSNPSAERVIVGDVDMISISSGETNGTNGKRRKRDVLKQLFAKKKDKSQ